jgi:ferric-dicitrate binding protein FerR (iron transport regulator)
VEVSNPGGTVEVGPGQVCLVESGGQPEVTVADDVYALLSWSDGILVYQATPLSQVAEEVSRHYGRPLRVADPNLARRRITAWFLEEPFEEVAEALCQAAGAVCRVDGTGVSMDMGEAG